VRGAGVRGGTAEPDYSNNLPALNKAGCRLQEGRRGRRAWRARPAEMNRTGGIQCPAESPPMPAVHAVEHIRQLNRGVR